MVNQVVYTNSRCSDLWEMFRKQNAKHYGSDVFWITDVKIPDVSDEYQYVYDNGSPFFQAWIGALGKFDLKTFIYLQEDFVLYNKVDSSLIDGYETYLTSSDYSFVRLIKTGLDSEKRIGYSIYELNPSCDNLFSMQATIWKSDEFVRLLKIASPKNWRDEDICNSFARKSDFRGVYHYSGERKIGEAHWDTRAYPYIATAIVRGKWNTKEYPILSDLLREYNIDPNVRGLHV